jgi:hypothetical protein
MVVDHVRRIGFWLILVWGAIGFWLSMSGYRHLVWVFVLLIPLTLTITSLWRLRLQKNSKQDQA